MVDHLLGLGFFSKLADLSWGPSQTNLVILTSLILFVVIFTLIMRRRRRHQHTNQPPDSSGRVQPLFNRVEVRLGDGQTITCEAFLRSLTPGRATILMQGYDVPKGVPVELDLSTLNGSSALPFHDRRSVFGHVQGRVVRVQPLDLEEKNILINVAFNDKNAVPSQLLKQDGFDSVGEARAVTTSSQLEIL